MITLGAPVDKTAEECLKNATECLSSYIKLWGGTAEVLHSNPGEYVTLRLDNKHSNRMWEITLTINDMGHVRATCYINQSGWLQSRKVTDIGIADLLHNHISFGV